MAGDLGKLLIFLGVGIFLLGLILTFSDKIPIIGRLPGDIHIKRDGFSLYIPIASSVLISIVLTVILSIFRR